MNMKNRIKTYAFWVALSSAVVILLQSIGKLFGFEVESSTIENVIMSICGVLIVLGIVSNSGDNSDNHSGGAEGETDLPDTSDQPADPEKQDGDDDSKLA